MQCYIRFLPGWSGAETKWTSLNWISKVDRQQALKAYCPNIYTVTSDEFPLQESDNRQL